MFSEYIFNIILYVSRIYCVEIILLPEFSSGDSNDEFQQDSEYTDTAAGL